MGTTCKNYEAPFMRVHEVKPFMPVCGSPDASVLSDEGTEGYKSESTSDWF